MRRQQADVLGAGVAQTAIARGMGQDPAVVCRWLSEDYADSMPAWALPMWTREVGPSLLEWMAEQAGYTLVSEDPHTEAQPGDLTAAISLHSGALVAQLIQARADKIDPRCAIRETVAKEQRPGGLLDPAMRREA